jgi:hypothetical protein
MQDAFTGLPTCLSGRRIPGPEERSRLQHDHERRLEALARIRACAAECGVATDPDRDLVTIPEDAVALLELSDARWAELGEAIRAWRQLLPLRPLEDFGFPADAENPIEEPNRRLRRIGGGVEAWAFAAETDGSVYKFYLPREEKQIGSVFGFRRGDESALHAEATLGDYRALLEKLLLIHVLSGMATEGVAVTPEGSVVAKQTLGDPLPQGDDMSGALPNGLIEIPSRFLRATRDHPRLLFTRHGDTMRGWLVADLHARNFVRGVDGGLYVIDLVAAPWPDDAAVGDPLSPEWLERVRRDPTAGALRAANDDEL